MVIEFLTLNAPPKSFGKFYTHVDLKLSLQDAFGVLLNVIMKTSLIRRANEDRIHSSNQQ